MSKSAAEMRRAAHEEWQRSDYLRALGEERQGYVNRAEGALSEGNAREHARMVGRVAQVDAQIVARGGTVPDVPVPAAESDVESAAEPDGGVAPAQQPARRGRS